MIDKRDIKVTATFRHTTGRKTLEITQEDLEKITDNILRSAFQAIDRALEQAELSESDIDFILLAGGSSQLPGVADRIEERFHKKARIIPRDLMVSVASGAAIYQKEITKYPKSTRKKTKAGHILAVMENDNGASEPRHLIEHYEKLPYKKIIGNYSISPNQSEIILSLVEVLDDRDKIRRPLKKRKIHLKPGQKSLTVEVEMDEDRVLHIYTSDPQTGEKEEVMGVSGEDREQELNTIRKKLGIIKKILIGYEAQ